MSHDSNPTPGATDTDLFEWTHVLYRLFNSGGDLIYVGITKDIRSRFRQHSHESPWWREVADCRTEFHPDRRTLELVEKAEIATLRPRYNKRGNPDVENVRPTRSTPVKRKRPEQEPLPMPAPPPPRHGPDVVKVFPDGARLMSDGMVYGPQRVDNGGMEMVWCMDPAFRSGVGRPGHERCTVCEGWHHCKVYPWPEGRPLPSRGGHHL